MKPDYGKRLNPRQIKDIMDRRKAGELVSIIARDYDVSVTTVYYHTDPIYKQNIADRRAQLKEDDMRHHAT